jgi:UDP-glucose:(heptosyl)LPS alpha-1,3-glucosyltransferase
MPLRIALNHTRLEKSGGVEGYLWNLLAHLLDRGHSVDFFAAKFGARLEHPGLRLIRVPILKNPRPAKVATFALQSSRIIQQEEARRPYDVVQGFSQTFHHTVYRDGSGCRQDYRELYLDTIGRSPLARLRARLGLTDWITMRIEKARYVRRPQRVIIAISSFVRDQILRRYPVKPETVRVVYSGVDCDRFHPTKREAGRALIAGIAGIAGAPVDPRARWIAFVGNDYLRKGLDIILDALALLVRGGMPVRARPYLVVVGRDPGAGRFEARARSLRIADRVRFLGPRQDIPEILAGSDVLCLPTRFDAYANVSSEALASGTPVIASATSGASELIRPAFGRVLARNDAAELAAALSEILSLDDPEPLRLAAREAALPLAWARHYGEIESIYAEAAARTPGGSWAAPRAPGHAR